MERYQQGKIYAIRSNQTDEVYIGSTCLSLAKRLFNHRSGAKRYKAGTGTYISSCKMIEYPDHYIELIELHPCNSKAELCKREGEIMREHLNRVNKTIAGRTKVEYYEDNKDNILADRKTYYISNTHTIKNRVKTYRELHKEYLTGYNLDYRNTNKEYLKDVVSKKIECLCGKTHRHGDTARHKKTKHHIKAMDLLIKA